MSFEHTSRPSQPREEESSEPSPARLEAFSDGVMAVIITIMVLEFKVPHEPGAAGLLAVLPTFLVYLMSFIYAGIYWTSHHRLIDRLERVNHLILWANLAFLFCLSLTPFVTSNLVEKHIDAFSVGVYIGSLLATGAVFGVLQAAVTHYLRRAGFTADPDRIAMNISEQRKGLVSLAIYLAGIAVAGFNARLGLACAAVVAVMWMFPPRGHKTFPRSIPPSAPR